MPQPPTTNFDTTMDIDPPQAHDPMDEGQNYDEGRYDDEEFQVLDQFLIDGLATGDLDFDQQGWVVDQAWEMWKELEDTARTGLVERIEQYNQALEICKEAEDTFEVQRRDGSFDDRIAPILIEPIEDMSNEDMNTILTYHRAVVVIDKAMEALMDDAMGLLAAFQVVGMTEIGGPILHELRNKLMAKGQVLDSQSNWLDKVIKSPEFVARAAAARPAETLRSAISASGAKIWMPCLDIGGSGKEDKLWLWLGYDDEGHIIDRYVHKIEDNQGMTTTVVDAQGRTVNLEYYLQNMCWEQDNHSFVKIRNCVVQGTVVEFKIEYCPFGDMQQQMRRFKKIYKAVPEPILWYIFHKLAEQCLIMQRGSVMYPVPHWYEIVHRDIKLCNLFVDLPTPDFFPKYPTAKLADFGFAFQTHTGDFANPINVWKSGTPLYLAPEQVVQIRRDDKSIHRIPRYGYEVPQPPHKLEKLLAHTNIWAMGMCMLQLVSQVEMHSSSQKYYEYGFPEEFGISAWSRDHYSPQLLDLIQRCMRFFPRDRITTDDLLSEIQKEMATVPGEVGEYCRDAADGDQVEGGIYDWNTGREKYKVTGGVPDEDVVGLAL